MIESKLSRSEPDSNPIPRQAGVEMLRHSSRTARRLVQVALLFLAGLISLSAHANITCNTGNVSKVLTAGTISVPVNAAAGTIVSKLAPDTFQMLCKFLNSGSLDTSAISYADFKTTAPLVTGYTDVYQTGTAGLGIRYTFNSVPCNATNVVMTNGIATLACPFTGPLGGAYTSADMSVTATLVVTGAIRSGAAILSSVPTVTIAYRTSDASGSWLQPPPLYTGVATGTLIGATCSVSQASVAVTLPTVSTGAFSSKIGSIARSQPFSLTFNCSAGAKVWITLTNNVNPANRSGTLQLTADSTTKGIGIQILKGGSPVLFGADSAAPGNTNQWLIGDSPNGALQVPLTARYVSTAPVFAGTVKALATFTMSYQ